MTDHNPIAEEYLNWVGNDQSAIPFIAIIPAGRANEVITFDGPVTAGAIQAALKKAGPSIVN